MEMMDRIHCLACDKISLIELGGNTCPECSVVGMNVWADTREPEVEV